MSAVSAFSVAACGGAADGSEPSAATSEDLVTHAPVPFGLQFVGDYADAAAVTGAISRLELHRNGTYTAHFQGQTRSERGAFVGPAHPVIPYVFRLIARGHSWTATVTGYNAALTIARSGLTSVAVAAGTVGPNEGLCDASGGSWTDDDPDPATGLYCVCPAPLVYISSAGGCVR